jgi:AraC family transcriptional regulator
MKKTTMIWTATIFIASAIVVSASAQQPEATTSVKVRDKIEPFYYACLTHRGPIEDMQNVIGTLMMNMQAQNLLPPMGPLVGIFYTSPGLTKAEDMQWELGFPVTAQALVQNPLELKKWGYTTAAVCLHVGPYDKSVETINKVMEWINSNGYTADGPVMEQYLDMDPSSVRPDKLKTEIWVPCKKIGG